MKEKVLILGKVNVCLLIKINVNRYNLLRMPNSPIGNLLISLIHVDLSVNLKHSQPLNSHTKGNNVSSIKKNKNLLRITKILEVGQCWLSEKIILEKISMMKWYINFPKSTKVKLWPFLVSKKEIQDWKSLILVDQE